MSQEAVQRKIRELAGRYPEGRSALLPVLALMQQGRGGVLSRDDVRTAARSLGIPFASAWGTASFYSMFTPPEDHGYQLWKGAGESAGGDAVPVRGTAESAPETFHYSACGILLKNFDAPAMEFLSTARTRGAYDAFGKAQSMTAGGIIAAVEASGLRGRGGASFPTGKKWRFLPRDDRPVYLICNADEGEPGTFKDRQIMERDPHLLVEGIAIAARALRSKRAFIYIRGEYARAAGILENAVGEAAGAGLLDGLEITIHRGAGSYICGEETALISSLEGGRGDPRPRPPYPAERGLYGCPTIVNNVETLAALPFIIGEGPEAFRRVSPALFSVSGSVSRPGLYEYPLGTPLRELLEAAGGVDGKLKGVIVGGLSSEILTAAGAEGLRLDYDSCLAAGTSFGTGAVIVLDETVLVAPLALRAARFFAGESCGQCVPCREGMFAAALLLEKIVAGEGGRDDAGRILEICSGVAGSSLCPGGDSFASSIGAMVSRFPGEFEGR